MGVQVHEAPGRRLDDEHRRVGPGVLAALPEGGGRAEGDLGEIQRGEARPFMLAIVSRR